MPPAPGSATAAYTSSTDSGVSRISASLTTFTEQRYPDRAGMADGAARHRPANHDRSFGQTTGAGGARCPGTDPHNPLAATAAAADLADDRRRADHRDGGAGRGDGCFLARDAAGSGPVQRPGLDQGLQHGGVVVGRAPARLAQGLAVDDPRVDQVAQIVDGRGSDPDPVEPLRGAEGQGGRQLDPAQPADLLDLGELQPAVAADREVARHVPGHGQLECGDEIIDVTELPALRTALDRQQP